MSELWHQYFKTVESNYMYRSEKRFILYILLLLAVHTWLINRNLYSLYILYFKFIYFV